MFQLTRYQGTAAGHVPVGRPRPWTDALRLLQHANQVNGDVWAYRLACVSPELPRFVCADKPLRWVCTDTDYSF